MKHTLMIATILAIGLTSAPVFGQDTTQTPPDNPQEVQHGPRFVDEDGDGYNDNAPDHDGDGIPNGLDEDYVNNRGESGRGFIDEDGDGINDNAMRRHQNRGRNMRGGYGPGDGTGFGPGNGNGSGPGNGTQGPDNKQKRNKKGGPNKG